MKKNLRLVSIVSFVVSVPALIITDWYYKGFGLLPMFLFLTIGLITDQFIRIKYPANEIKNLDNYILNRVFHMVALIFFVWAPMALIYMNRIKSGLGFWIMVVMVCCGIISDQIGRIKYSNY